MTETDRIPPASMILIITGGYNVYPKEGELILDDINGVVESADIGVPYPDFGKAVVGVLVMEEGSRC